MSELSKRRAVGDSGETLPVGSHFRAADDPQVPFGDGSAPAPLGLLVLDVLRSDTPVVRGERILYRLADGAAEYRVLSARARGGDGDWATAVLMERCGSIPDPEPGRHPGRVHEVGLDGGWDVEQPDAGEMSLSALYESYFEPSVFILDDPLPPELP